MILISGDFADKLLLIPYSFHGPTRLWLAAALALLGQGKNQSSYINVDKYR